MFARGYMAAELAREAGVSFWDVFLARDWSGFHARVEAKLLRLRKDRQAETMIDAANFILQLGQRKSEEGYVIEALRYSFIAKFLAMRVLTLA